MGTPLLFFERLLDFRKIPFLHSFVLLLGSNWYLGDTNWYLTIFTLFRMVRTGTTTAPTPTPA